MTGQSTIVVVVASGRQQSETSRYFAYGANMASRVLVGRRGVHPLASEVARLDDYRLTFTEPGLPWLEPVFASIEPAPGEHVHGVLHTLDPEGSRRIDGFEGTTYERFDVEVTTAGGPVAAWAYRARRPVRGRRPSRRYLEILVEGALEHGLPAEHVERLRREEGISVPVLSRLLPALLRGWERGMARSERLLRLAHRLYELSERSMNRDGDAGTGHDGDGSD